MLRSSDDLEAKVIEIGFLPFFHNSVKGFSIQEMVRSEERRVGKECRL